MRRLFQDLTKRLQTFVSQRDVLLLLVRCRDEECAFVIKTLDSIDEAGPDFFWMFATDFAEPASYVEAVVRTFRERVDALALKLEESGDPPWPPFPAPAADPKTAPVTRLQLLLMYARTRIPDLEASHLVAALMPLRIDDPLSWRVFLGELTKYDPLAPWCHHMRIVARENPEVSTDALSPDLRSRLDPKNFPSAETSDVDFSLAALQQATKDEIADPSVPIPERMQSLLIDANVDYSNRRYPIAIQKYELLRTFYATVGNRAMLAASLNGLGEIYAATKRPALAVEHFEMAITAAIEGDCNPVLLNVSLNLGNLYLAAKQWPEAIEHYVAAEALATALLNANIKLLCLENIGACRLQLADYAGAQEAWQSGAELARALGEHDAQRRLLLRLRELYTEARMRDRVSAVDDELRGLP
jgi:tetratricopeptide (TPR) repeat protein